MVALPRVEHTSVAFASFVVLACPAASSERQGGMAAAENAPISGIPRGPTNAGGKNGE
jgi:hypothetical protein